MLGDRVYSSSGLGRRVSADALRQRTAGARHLSWLSPVKVRRMMLSASSRMTVWDDVDPSEKLRIYDKGVVRNPTHETFSQQMVSYRLGDVRIPILDGREPLAKLVDDVHAGIRDGAPTRVGERVGYDVVRCIEAACASVESGGGWVTFPARPRSLGLACVRRMASTDGDAMQSRGWPASRQRPRAAATRGDSTRRCDAADASRPSSSHWRVAARPSALRRPRAIRRRSLRRKRTPGAAGCEPKVHARSAIAETSPACGTNSATRAEPASAYRFHGRARRSSQPLRSEERRAAVRRRARRRAPVECKRYARRRPHERIHAVGEPRGVSPSESARNPSAPWIGTLA